MRPGALLLLILRAHGTGRDLGWPPNQLSRQTNEIEATLTALASSDFENPLLEGKLGASSIVTASRRLDGNTSESVAGGVRASVDASAPTE